MGILDDSLSSDGLQKSDGIRERDAKNTVSGVKVASRVGNPSDDRRECRIARTGPQEPQQARRRPRLRALQNVERSFHLRTMVEGMLLSSKLLSIGRLPEFADRNTPLRIAVVEIIHPTGT